MAEALQMRDFVASFMHEQVVATCASRGFAQSGRLSAAYVAWKAPLAQSIAQGEGVLLRRYAEFGGSRETLRSEMTKRYRADTEPMVTSNVAAACDARVRLLETGVPVPFSGRSGTDHRLRIDIYNQAQMASTCWQVDSIKASVVNFDPQGKSEERWVVAGCGKPVPVSVTYSPNACSSRPKRVPPRRDRRMLSRWVMRAMYAGPESPRSLRRPATRFAAGSAPGGTDRLRRGRTA
jgi:hypothetical protein